MKVNKFLFVLLSISLFLGSGCTPKEGIKSIDALYFSDIFNHNSIAQRRDKMKVTIPDFTEKFMERGIYPAEITDRQALKEIEAELAKLTPSDRYASINNVRMIFDVHYYDGTVKQIDLCGPFSNDIFVDGELKETNNRLLYLLKNNIGFYSWVKDDPLFNRFQEINDTEITKEPIIESDWHMEYLKHKVILE